MWGLVLQKREEAGAASAFPYSIPAVRIRGMGAEKGARERAPRERGRYGAGLGERRV